MFGWAAGSERSRRCRRRGRRFGEATRALKQIDGRRLVQVLRRHRQGRHAAVRAERLAAFFQHTFEHSSFRAAAAEVLLDSPASDQFFDGLTQVPCDRNRDGVSGLVGELMAPLTSLSIEPGLQSQPLVLRLRTPNEAADEAGFWHGYGGIQFHYCGL